MKSKTCKLEELLPMIRKNPELKFRIKSRKDWLQGADGFADISCDGLMGEFEYQIEPENFEWEETVSALGVIHVDQKYAGRRFKLTAVEIDE